MDQQTAACMALMRSVIMQCIKDHQYNLMYKGQEKAMAEEPARFLMSDEDRPYSFVWMCQYLGLNPQRLREVMNNRNLLSDKKKSLSNNA